jgi:ADP-ribose pyrophosphatase YjhB (NUDIX family)
MKFNNRQNECIIHPEKKTQVFLSRSVAVVVKVIRNDKVLFVKRGTSVSHTGKWCMPCGYLDYDETLKEAAMRELYEETGYIASSVEDFELIRIDDNPHSNLQNISFTFSINFDKLATDNEWQMDLYEVTDMGFFNKKQSQDMEFAFDHKNIAFQN